MIKAVVFLAIVASAFAAHLPIRQHSDERIVGGNDVNIQDFPYQLSLQYLDRHICGSSIIGPNWALTTATCVYNYPEEKIFFRAGSSIRESGGSVHNTSKIFLHPNFSISALDYNYALVKVVEPFNIGSTGVNRILLTQTEPSVGNKLVVSGWGTTSDDISTLPKQLQAVTVPAISWTDCNNSYAFITDRMFCAGYPEGGKNPCQYDWGDPIINTETGMQVGIFSTGHICADPRYPGVYSNVAAARQWITSLSGI